ncbi:MAG: hypothetical protein BWY44_01265 [Candidatus Omnitrophica bacterium ADurb.Bin292]|nr:MAG: hypothetical protein BWY44_01265 [Candidatus Omnitrophica bacterium ADurb.Bin292]
MMIKLKISVQIRHPAPRPRVTGSAFIRQTSFRYHPLQLQELSKHLSGINMLGLLQNDGAI